MTSLNDLPSELIVKILEYTEVVDIVNFSEVSKDCYMDAHLVKNNNLYILKLEYIDCLPFWSRSLNFKLKLSYARGGVSVLSNLHTLDLHMCKVADVSSLKNLHTLNIYSSENIGDVSALGGVRTLKIINCN